MIISVNWLKKLTNIEMSVDDLAARIGARLVEIEEVVYLGEKYHGITVARVVSCSQVEGSDHLSVALLDDGRITQGVDRDAEGRVQVVCGAPNVREGLVVAWIPPGVAVPSTVHTAEPFVLGKRKLRGVMSNGMIASAKELDLYDDHAGILELDESVRPGTPFIEAYDLDDVLLDIENKSLTHRPDTFGMIGFAREVAGIQGEAFQTPDWLRDLAPDFNADNKELHAPSVTISDAELSPRYQAVVLSGDGSKQMSPLWMQSLLAKVGMRPVNAVVDITNYLMILTGQPLHAFDYDKLVAVAGGKADITVRAAREGEKLVLLDDKEITLSEKDIVIAAGDIPVALAGAMGGKSTEIDAGTKRIILESATFNLYNLRATQMRHGIFSEAITRFTKGLSAPQTAPVLKEAVRLLDEHAGLSQVSDVGEAYPNPSVKHAVDISTVQLNAILGTHLPVEDIALTLQNVEFLVEVDGERLHVTPPYWRTDIHIPEDIAEEVGRLNGFDSIIPSLPRRDFAAVTMSGIDRLKSDVRRILARAGANEVLTYSFVHGDLLKKAEQKPQDSYKIINSISPDLQYYRQTLTPSLLSLVHPNSKAGYDDFALFEINKTHTKVHKNDQEGLPGELHMLGLVVTRSQPEGAPFYQAKNLLAYVGTSLGLSFVYDPIDTDPGFPVTAPYNWRRSSMVTDVHSGEFIGIVGEYKQDVAKSFKLPQMTAGFEVGVEGLLRAYQKRLNAYRPPSKFPGTERDICFKVAKEVQYQAVAGSLVAALKKQSVEVLVDPVDIYQADGQSTKNITVRLTFTPYDRTLTAEEANQIAHDAGQRVLEEVGGEIV